MENTKKKSKLVFNLEFTTSKLLAYILVLLSGFLGYALLSSEVVIIGFFIAGALSGVKSLSDNVVKMKSAFTAGGEDKKEKEIL